MFRRWGCAILVIGTMAGPALADPVDGNWKTAPAAAGGYGIVAMADCGGKVCGKLTSSFDKAGKPVKSPDLGKNIISGMTSKGDGSYSGGKVFVPARGKTYDGTMTMKGDALTISVCELGACRDQVWTRQK